MSARARCRVLCGLSACVCVCVCVCVCLCVCSALQENMSLHNSVLSARRLLTTRNPLNAQQIALFYAFAAHANKWFAAAAVIGLLAFGLQ